MSKGETVKNNDTALVAVKTNDLEKLWEENNQVLRETYCANSTPQEFNFFKAFCIARNLNPIKGDVYFIKRKMKDGSYKITMPIARGLLRKRAQKFPTHNGQIVEALYADDDYSNEIVGNKRSVSHKFNFSKPRGVLVGAYSLTFDTRYDEPVYEWCPFHEFDQGHSTWKVKPESMIKKCASAAGYRAAYADDFDGMYEEDEMPTQKLAATPTQHAKLAIKPPPAQIEPQIIELKTDEGEVVDAEFTPKNEPAPEPVPPITWVEFVDFARESGVTEKGINLYAARHKDNPTRALEILWAKRELYPQMLRPVWIGVNE